MNKLVLSIILVILATCTGLTVQQLKDTPKVEKITASDARDQRQLSNFDDSYRQKSQPQIQKRIATNHPFNDSPVNYVNSFHGGYEKDFQYAASSYPQVQQSYGPSYSIQPSHYVGGYQQQQYVEAPEPIIEIIIKDSNETLPPPEPIKYHPQKKKKEQVQVFYVKYNKDEKKGLVIDDPIPALTPTHFNHDESEEVEEHYDALPYVQPTVPPPSRTTTLRTIIKPESEVYHSNSGIQVTFNTESKHQSGHEFQENYEESVVQPIVTDARGQVNEHQHQTRLTQTSHQFGQPSFNVNDRAPVNHQFNNNDRAQPTFNGNDRAPQNHQFANNDRARAFEIQYNNHASGQILQPTFHHRFAPPQQVSHASQPTFLKPTPDQGLLLNYQQNQANRLFQTQNFKNHAPVERQPPSNHRFTDPTFLSLAPPNSSPAAKFRPQSLNQPKPIPIPLHHHEKNAHPSHSAPSQIQQLNHHQHYINYKQFQNQRPKPQPHQTISFQQSYPQPITGQIPSNHRLTQATNQPQVAIPQAPPSTQQSSFSSQEIHNKGLFQQKAPNLGSNTGNVFNNQPNQHPFAGNAQDFNRIVSGAELVESLPKFEQHITETVPLSEINKPFSPFRQISSIQTSSLPIITQAQSVPTQSVEQLSIQKPRIQEQNRIQQQQQQQQQHFDNQNIVQVHAPQRQQHPTILTQTQSQSPQYQGQSQQYQSQQEYQQSQHIKNLYQQEQANIVSSKQPQIVFPVNYNKNYLQESSFNLNLLSTPSTRSPPIFREKVIPGKGVSNLATDVFAEDDDDKEENIYQQLDPRNKFTIHAAPSQSQNLASTERNYVTNYVTQKVRATSYAPSTTTTTTSKPLPKKPVLDLPDEVPDDLRQQLLSSGILDNAEISILDYDKVGETPLEQLPPEHLANFYGAGGASQISSSNRVLNIVKPNGDHVSNVRLNDDDKFEEKKMKTVPKKHNVDLKVVHFDSSNQKTIADKYIKQDSTVLPSVDINQPYNRYLPLKVNGEQFPIPDVDSLRNKKISSVVVLAPVDGLSSNENDGDNQRTDNDDDIIEDGRYERDVIDSKEVKFLAGDSLKNLLRKPTKENFKRWLDKEAKSNVDMQSVVLLVVRNETNGQEIYMYDIGTKIVSRLKGELSSAFVNVAETNANAQEDDSNHDNITLIDSGIFEKMPAMNSDNQKITIIQAQSTSSSSSSSTSTTKHHQPIFRRDNSQNIVNVKSNDDPSKISISSGYSVIRR